MGKARKRNSRSSLITHRGMAIPSKLHVHCL